MVSTPQNEVQGDALDMVIVGAGWAGLYAIVKAKALGLNAVVLEAGDGVGGTWYWNRYPGARCDVPSFNYSYSFDDGLQQEWHWSERYAAQPEIERYANHVVERFGLAPHIVFNTKVTGATWDGEKSEWVTTTNDGQTRRSRYLVLATGGYSEPVTPNIPGWDTFTGESYFTTRWPDEEIDYTGKRIAVIGVGSSGMQTITALSREPIESLTVFQRTPNYVVPARNRVHSDAEEAEIKQNYGDYRERARRSGSGTLYDGESLKVADLSEDEFQAHMARLIEIGGTSVLGGVQDLLQSKVANERVSEYLREHIRSRVNDPETAEKLIPHGYHLGSRRVLFENDYLESYNFEHVSLVDVRQDPIVEITPKGIRTQSGEQEFDVIIFATGFDSGSGALLKINVVGEDGERLADHWSAGPSTYLGLGIHGFPNAFAIAGPGSPAIRSNVIVTIEQHIEWLFDLLSSAQAQGAAVIEATSEAEGEWTHHVADIVSRTMLAEDDTQYWGANVPGKPRTYLAYIGGVGAFRAISDDVRERDYEGFELRTANGDVVGTRSAHWSGPRTDGSIQTRFGTPII